MNFTNTNQNQNRTGDKKMTFTNTDCVSYDIYWDYDYDQLDEEVDDELRWDMMTQVESQVERQVYVHHNPIKNKITQEINK